MISIIIPTYNEEKTIDNILSLFQSKLTIPHEIIVSDDFSTDKTVDIAKKYNCIVLCPKSKHITIAANRNEGARKAQSDILVFMDSDVYINDPDKFFTRAISIFDNNSNLVALTGKLRVIPKLETFADKIIYIIFNYVHHIKNNIFHTGEASGKFQMIRKNAFNKVGGYREDLVSREDADIFQRLTKIGETRYEPSLIIFHTGRRAHNIGWPKILYIWMRDAFWVTITGLSASKEWRPIR